MIGRGHGAAGCIGGWGDGRLWSGVARAAGGCWQNTVRRARAAFGRYKEGRRRGGTGPPMQVLLARYKQLRARLADV